MTGVNPAALGLTDSSRKLIEFMKRVGGEWVVVLYFADPDSKLKSEWLLQGGRDFFSVTGAMKNRILTALKQAVFEGASPILPQYSERLMAAAAKAAREQIVARFTEQGADMSLHPLSPSWLAYKRRHHLAPFIGIATYELFRDVAVTATVKLERAAAFSTPAPHSMQRR